MIAGIRLVREKQVGPHLSRIGNVRLKCEARIIGMTGDNDAVLDIYGNNAAVRCPSCGGIFVFARYLSAKNGRPCPHCNKSIARVADEHISVSVVKQCDPTKYVRTISTTIR